MQNTSALHWTLLVALLASPVGARRATRHVDGIMEALVKIYDAHRVAEELTGK